MNRFTSLASLVAVGLLAGCSAASPDPEPNAPLTQPPTSTPTNGDHPGPQGATPPAETAAIQAGVDANLQALRDLQIVEVGRVVENIPQAANCYGFPCPGHETEFADAKAQAAAALAAFTKTALEAASSSAHDEALATRHICYETDQANLQKLKDLHIVLLGDVVLEKPQASNCYSIPAALRLNRIVAAVIKP